MVFDLARGNPASDLAGEFNVSPVALILDDFCEAGGGDFAERRCGFERGRSELSRFDDGG